MERVAYVCSSLVVGLFVLLDGVDDLMYLGCCLVVVFIVGCLEYDIFWDCWLVWCIVAVFWLCGLWLLDWWFGLMFVC